MKKFALVLVIVFRLMLSDGILLRNNPEVIARSTYDYVIVGSGSAGSVLAARLAETPGVTVLLLEVGKRPNFIVDIPITAPALQFTDYAWNYTMEKTPGVCLGIKAQRCRWPRGRGVGGSTLINYMIYTRGNRLDYDRWAAQGNPGWSYEEVLPYFKKSEDSHLDTSDVEYHGRGGPLNVEYPKYRSKIAPCFLKAAAVMGAPILDYNGKKQEGFSIVQANTKQGSRHSGYKAFIRPAELRYPNLHVLPESRATKILIDPVTKQAYGVQYVRNRQWHYVNFTREVILSAGAFNSPQLLMLSGIGPKQDLESLKIPVIHDLPGVGQNLQDHIAFAGLIYYVEGDLDLIDAMQLRKPSVFLDWIKYGTGPLASIGGVEVLGYIRTNASRDSVYNKYLDLPDMELIILSGTYDKDLAEIVKDTFGINDNISREVWSKLIGKKVCIILPMHLKPKSVGYLKLKSTNPYHWPLFYGNHLSDSENYDVRAFISAIRYVQRLMATEPFQKYNAKQLDTPLPGCENYIYDTDAYWECSIRHITSTLHHQVGTCKMGPKNDRNAVVDNELRLYGIKKVRVADTSIIPFALNAHTNAPSYMIGEKASDMLKNTWKTYY